MKYPRSTIVTLCAASALCATASADEQDWIARAKALKTGKDYKAFNHPLSTASRSDGDLLAAALRQASNDQRAPLDGEHLAVSSHTASGTDLERHDQPASASNRSELAAPSVRSAAEANPNAAAVSRHAP
jgi:hypothetical protein